MEIPHMESQLLDTAKWDIRNRCDINVAKI